MPLSCFTYKIATCLVFSAVVKCKSHYAIAQLTACHWLPVALRMKLKCISWPLWLRIVSLLCTSLFLFLATLWIALYSPVILTFFYSLKTLSILLYMAFVILFLLPKHFLSLPFIVCPLLILYNYD